MASSNDIALPEIPKPNTKFNQPYSLEDGLRTESHSNHLIDQSANSPIHEFSLPRADGGKEAWLFLAGCFFVEALVWGE